MTAIDTLRLSRHWQGAGLSKEQADKMVEALNEELGDDRPDIAAAKESIGWIKIVCAIFAAAHLAQISMLVAILSRLPG